MLKKFNFFLLLFFCLQTTGIASVSLGNSFSISPFQNFKEINSEHFKVIFPKELEDPSQKVINYLEEAHQILSPLFKWEPKTQTQIVLLDNSDAANGLTSALLRIGIVLYLTPPENTFSTYYYDNWLRLLCMHEYVHYLNLDATRSFNEVFHVLFGDIWKPNHLLPTWLIEGMAVYFETASSKKSGRGNSPFYDMVLRTAIYENTLNNKDWITLDRVNGTTPYSPFGETPYLFGFYLVNEFVKHTPEKKGLHLPYQKGEQIGEYSDRSAGRVPYFINGNAENISGKSWNDHWDHFVDQSKKLANNQIKEIRIKPLTNYKKISQRKITSERGGAISDDGRYLVWNERSSYRRSRIELKDLSKQEKSKTIADRRFGNRMAFIPKTHWLIYNSFEQNKTFNTFSDLFAIEVETGKEKRLSDSKRLKDPWVSPNGNEIVFTITQNQTVGLAKSNLIFENEIPKMSEPEILWMPERYGRVSHPIFHKSQIIFSFHPAENSQENLMSFDLKTKKISTIKQNEGIYYRNPISHNGHLYYISDITGIDNIYELKDGQSVALTNFISGASLPFFAPDGTLYASIYESFGWKISKIDNIKQSEISKISKADHQIDLPKIQYETNQYTSENYHLLKTIAPRQWAPILLYSNNRSLVGGQISSFDSTYRLSYSLFAGYDFLVKQGEYAATISTRFWGPTLSLGSSLLTSSISASEGDLISYTRNWIHFATLSFPFQWTWSTFTPSFTAALDKESDHDSGHGKINSEEEIPELTLQGIFNNSQVQLLQPDRRRGVRLHLGARSYLEKQNTTHKIFLGATGYFNLFNYATLSSSFAFSQSSRSSNFTSANVRVRGHSSGSFFSLFGGESAQSLTQLTVRGYPNVSLISRVASYAGLEYQMTLANLFRGFGTFPLFFKQLNLFAFGETIYFPISGLSKAWMPATGGGLRLKSDILLNIPLQVSVEYHYGIEKAYLGNSELLFSLGLPTVSF